MSASAISKRRHSQASVPARSRPVIDRRDLLEAAGRGDTRAVGQLCDRHGSALIGLARAIVGDIGRAEAVVVDVIARACADPGVMATCSDVLRHELARLTYLYATESINDAQQPVPGSAMAKMAHMTQLARQQRAAVALVQCGDHTVGEVAGLLGLPVQIVAVLLCSGLRELDATDRHLAPSGGSRQAGRGR